LYQTEDATMGRGEVTRIVEWCSEEDEEEEDEDEEDSDAVPDALIVNVGCRRTALSPFLPIPSPSTSGRP
jgi:hypothetical protein